MALLQKDVLTVAQGWVNKNPLPEINQVADPAFFYPVQTIFRPHDEGSLKLQSYTNSKAAVFYFLQISAIRYIR
jgi:hypothetical protein